MRTVGTRVRGIRAPIIKEGDDLVKIVVDSLLSAATEDHFTIGDQDIIGVTESLVAIAQGNFVTLDEITKDLRKKFDTEEIGVVFPILSRNRFAMILKAIARGFSKVSLLLSFPADEVGNTLMDQERMDEAGINPYTDLMTERKYRQIFGEEVPHPFTGIDYVKMYKNLSVNGNIDIYLANDPREILKVTRSVLAADIHGRQRTKKLLRKAGAKKVYGLDEICAEPVEGGGYNPQFGLLGSNMAGEERLKLFPRDGQTFVEKVQATLRELTEKEVEVMIYGDGAFKDPVGHIWELADPVVSPAYTSGLSGRSNEIKLKYLADSLISELHGEEAAREMKKIVREKKPDLGSDMDSLGTTPRQLTDLIGSLCDLTSGSGDKGTPIVLIQGYFDNYSAE